MLVSDFDYNLPKELIAQEPIEPRDSCRLMVLSRANKSIESRRFFDLLEYLHAGDVLVVNNSKVFKARLVVENKAGERAELFLLRPVTPLTMGIPHLASPLVQEGGKFLPSATPRPAEGEAPQMRGRGQGGDKEGGWEALAKPGRKFTVGSEWRVVEQKNVIPHQDAGSTTYVDVDSRFRGNDGRGFRVADKLSDGRILVDFGLPPDKVVELANQYGHVPVPPYIKKEPSDAGQYQTVYAKPVGSVAAPTAGFHFTPELLVKCQESGVRITEVTLHVGLGTFRPVQVEKIENHVMHPEWVEISKQASEQVNQAKQEGRRIIAVGTTAVRTLEGVVAQNNGKVVPYVGDLNLFIIPGYKFQVVDALITNFHLPKSTLMMLVSALAGREFILQAYQQAVAEKYRFFSFGDAMLIL